MPKPRVLVVDDDEDNLVVLETAISSWGFDVETSRSCAEAKAFLASHEVDALLTDFMLLDGTGVDLMRALGSRRPKLALLVTGFGAAEDRAASREAGFNEHLLKPIELSRLEELLRDALGGEKNATA